MRLFVLCMMAAGLMCVSAICANAQPGDDSGMQTDGKAGTDDSFKVMSFNIRFGDARDAPSLWEDRRAFLLETIKQYDPDVLCTQEGLLKQVRYLQEGLAGYEFFGVGRDDGKQAGEMCAIFYRGDRFERLDGGHFWLSEQPDVPGSTGWDAVLPRMASWLRLRDKHNGRVLLLADTHFDHVGHEARLNSARLLKMRLADLQQGASILLTGDFNCIEDDEPYQVLIPGEDQDALPLIDAYRFTHPKRDENEASCHAFTGNRKGSRIDWIMHGLGLTTLAADIDTTHDGQRYPSDHFPVTATLRWEEEK